MTATLHILNNPSRLSAQFKLNAYKFKYEEVRKEIRFKLTMAIIEEIMRDDC